MNVKPLWGAAVSLPLTLACGGTVDIGEPPVINDVGCVAELQPGNTHIPLFQRPFTGEYPLSDYFDHDLPFPSPSEFDNGFLLTFCGSRVRGYDGHSGYDWLMPVGTPLYAVASGVVTVAGQTLSSYCPALGKSVSALVVKIRHATPQGGPVESFYVHLDRADVQAGQAVQAGEQIGLSGNSGCSVLPHLHFAFAVNVDGDRAEVDPYGWQADFRDPWARHSQGAPSVWMWMEGEAPSLTR